MNVCIKCKYKQFYSIILWFLLEARLPIAQNCWATLESSEHGVDYFLTKRVFDRLLAQLLKVFHCLLKKNKP